MKISILVFLMFLIGVVILIWTAVEDVLLFIGTCLVMIPILLAAYTWLKDMWEWRDD